MGDNPFLVYDLTQNLGHLAYVGIFLLLAICRQSKAALLWVMSVFWMLAGALAATSFWLRLLPITVSTEYFILFVVSGCIALVLVIITVKPLMFVISIVLIIIGTVLSYVSPNFVNALANAQSVQAPYPLYFQEHGMRATTLVNDSLTQSSGSSWETSEGGTCLFSNQAYHVKTSAVNRSFSCHGPTATFQDFTYEVEMTILEGDCGGMVFGENSTHSAYYLFQVCQNRSYSLWQYTDGDGLQPIRLKYGTSKEISPNVGSMNRIAVLTQGSSIYFYIRDQQIAEIHNTNYSGGYIALSACSPDRNTTEVAYQNVKVWVD